MRLYNSSSKAKCALKCTYIHTYIHTHTFQSSSHRALISLSTVESWREMPIKTLIQYLDIYSTYIQLQLCRETYNYLLGFFQDIDGEDDSQNRENHYDNRDRYSRNHRVVVVLNSDVRNSNSGVNILKLLYSYLDKQT